MSESHWSYLISNLTEKLEEAGIIFLVFQRCFFFLSDHLGDYLQDVPRATERQSQYRCQYCAASPTLASHFSKLALGTSTEI